MTPPAAPSPRPGPWPAIGIVAVACALIFACWAGGCSHLPFVPTGGVGNPPPGPQPAPGPNDATWHLVGLLSIAAMVVGVAIAVAPIPTPRPLRGLSIAGTGLACLLLSNLMRAYERLLTDAAGCLLALSLILLGWFLWTHRRQLKARAEDLIDGEPQTPASGSSSGGAPSPSGGA